MSKIIITISREFGSGGHAIGQEVANRLGIEYYDQKIIDEAAKISGFSENFIQRTENNVGSFLYNIAMSTAYGTGFYGSAKDLLSLDTQVFLAQQDAIHKLAKNSCVIVGRCADYVLKNEENLLRCFIYAPLKYRVQRAIEEYGIERFEAQRTVQQIDKKRKNRYNAYTDRIWGSRENYDLMINSANFKIDGACNLITESVNDRFTTQVQQNSQKIKK